MQFDCLRDDVITSKPTWILKHTISILEYFEYFCQMSSKLILIILSYTISKLVHFWDSVEPPHCASKWQFDHSSSPTTSLGFRLMQYHALDLWHGINWVRAIKVRWTVSCMVLCAKPKLFTLCHVLDGMLHTGLAKLYS